MNRGRRRLLQRTRGRAEPHDSGHFCQPSAMLGRLAPDAVGLALAADSYWLGPSCLLLFHHTPLPPRLRTIKSLSPGNLFIASPWVLPLDPQCLCSRCPGHNGRGPQGPRRLLQLGCQLDVVIRGPSLANSALRASAKPLYLPAGPSAQGKHSAPPSSPPPHPYVPTSKPQPRIVKQLASRAHT